MFDNYKHGTLFVLLVFLSAVGPWAMCGAVPEPDVSETSVRYDASTNRFSLSADGPGEVVATARSVNAVNKTGWMYLEVNSTEWVPDHIQAYSTGLAEGHNTMGVVKMHWANLQADCGSRPYTGICSRYSNFLTANLQWMKEQIAASKQSPQPSPYWHQVELFLYQAAGMADGVNGELTAPHIDIDPMGYYMMQVIGDTDALEAAWKEEAQPAGSGSCSALVRLLNDSSELYVGHTTWMGYSQMLRVIKVYDLPWKTLSQHTEPVAARRQVFTSYPGTLISLDDFYLLSSGLVAVETTIGNANSALWRHVSHQSVLTGIRAMVANRLATSGQGWAELFKLHNSGTYNDEWMIVDYNKFRPGQKPQPPGLLTVLDQIPGTVKFSDLTGPLEQEGYFSSYNIPYFPEVFKASGMQEMVEWYGDYYSHDKCARALIFKRDYGNANNLTSMMKIMRYNNYQHDPLSRCDCTPHYRADLAISARDDLNPSGGTFPLYDLAHRLYGGIDAKVTSSGLARALSMQAVSGPTWDQQPPFQWSKSDFNHISHVGQPDLWQFQPILFNPAVMFQRP